MVYQNVQEIFNISTGDSGDLIYDYEIENWPKYVPLNHLLWDQPAVDAIQAALPSFKFHKKPSNWRPEPYLSNDENERLVNLGKINADLIAALNRKNGYDLQFIPWSFSPHDPLTWSPKKILKIYRNTLEFNARYEKEPLNASKDSDHKDLAAPVLSITSDFVSPNGFKDGFEYNLKRSACSLRPASNLEDDLDESENRLIKKSKLLDEQSKGSPQIFTETEQKDETSVNPVLLPSTDYDPKGRDDSTTDLFQVLLALMTKIDPVYLLDLSFISWDDCTVEGWPEGISFEPSDWTSQDLDKILDSIDDIEIHLLDELNHSQISEAFDLEAPFIPRSEQIIIEPIVDLKFQIMSISQLIEQKLRADLKLSEYEPVNLYAYDIENWPLLLPKYSRHWDDEAIFELRAALPHLIFKLKPGLLLLSTINNTILDREEASENTRQLIQIMLQKLRADSLGSFSSMPWSRFTPVNWPEGVPFGREIRHKQIYPRIILRNLPWIRFIAAK